MVVLDKLQDIKWRIHKVYSFDLTRYISFVLGPDLGPDVMKDGRMRPSNNQTLSSTLTLTTNRVDITHMLFFKVILFTYQFT